MNKYKNRYLVLYQGRGKLCSTVYKSKGLGGHISSEARNILRRALNNIKQN